ncbi:MAG: tRNA (adenosine(37)-N6)-threonylcarbamoyltransferase complex ATPase subunit type 1 TsaE [Vampirovibrionales bacterium]|nr:tRNA (adenosine(37)-N6)-threonylcarbamoyltransferase complex ATPase subunit type 1 TsaE [Vampirovibrionales bacterium]
MTLILKLNSLDDTRAVAAWLASHMVLGDALALVGGLGAGKTTFMQAVGKALGVVDRVTSPSYVLVHEYAAKTEALGLFTLTHADVYRLGCQQADSLAPELLPALESADGVVAVEWADEAAFLSEFLTLRLAFSVKDVTHEAEEPKRFLALTPLNERWGQILLLAPYAVNFPDVAYELSETARV